MMTVYREMTHGFLGYAFPGGVSVAKRCVREAAVMLKELLGTIKKKDVIRENQEILDEEKGILNEKRKKINEEMDKFEEKKEFMTEKIPLA